MKLPDALKLGKLIKRQAWTHYIREFDEKFYAEFFNENEIKESWVHLTKTDIFAEDWKVLEDRININLSSSEYFDLFEKYLLESIKENHFKWCGSDGKWDLLVGDTMAKIWKNFLEKSNETKNSP